MPPPAGLVAAIQRDSQQRAPGLDIDTHPDNTDNGRIMSGSAAQPAPEWPTVEEAARMLSTSTRTIARWISERRLASQKSPRAGRKPVVIVDPRDLERIRSEQQTSVVLPPVSNDAVKQESKIARKQETQSGVTGDQWKLMAKLLSIQLESHRAPFMDLEVASEYSCLPVRLLRRLIRQDKLPACRFKGTWYVKRENLDGIDFDLACEGK
jgi:excisionase family DNA binding protein